MNIFGCSEDIVHKGASVPFLRHPPLDQACPPPPFLKFLFLHLSFLFQPHANTSCPNPTLQPSLHVINEFKQRSKGCDFTSSIVAFYQNLIFDFLYPFRNINL